jgi:hypothetical protein
MTDKKPLALNIIDLTGARLLIISRLPITGSHQTGLRVGSTRGTYV